MRPQYLSCFFLTLLPFVSSAAETNPAPSLYLRLGGKAVVDVVVAQALAQVAADPAVNKSFKGVDLKKLDAKVAEQFCALTAGGCKYSGDSMKDVHAGLDITEREFYALVEALRQSLDANGVREKEKNELLRILAPMKHDVVTR